MTLIAFMVLAGLAGCARTELTEVEEGGFTDKGTNYLAFNIVSDGGNSTRAWEGGGAGEADDDEFQWDETMGGDEERMCNDAGAHWAIFFNQDDSFHSMHVLESATVTDPVGGTDAAHYNEKVIAKCVAQVKTGEGQSLPTKVLVVLNARPNRMDIIQQELEKGSRDGFTLPDGTRAKTDAEYLLARLTEELSDTDIKNGGTSVSLYTPAVRSGEKIYNYCTMTSTTYVEGSKEDSQTGNVHTMELIPDGKIAPTEEEAKNNPMTVHVERMTVKVEVDYGNDDAHIKMLGKEKDSFWGTPDEYGHDKGPGYPILMTPRDDNKLTQVTPDGDEVSQKWGAVIWGWTTNAIARRTYLFKNLNDAMGDADKAHTSPRHHNANDKKIDEKFFDNWNEEARHRCYWAVDGRYADPSIYPTQYLPAADGTVSSRPYQGMYEEENDEFKNESPLYYYSYKDIRMITMGYAPTEENEKPGTPKSQRGNLQGSTKYRYCPENVLGTELLEGNTYWGASTHVLFVGQLLLGDDEISKFENEYNEKGQSNDLMNSVSDKFVSGGKYYDRPGYMQLAYDKLYGTLTNGSTRSWKNIFGDDNDEVCSTPEGDLTLTVITNDNERVPLTARYLQDKKEILSKWYGGKTDGDDCDCVFRLVPAKVVSGDGRVMLALKEGYKLEVKNGETKTFDEKAFLSAVYEFSGYADLYKNGRMYYYTPIHHVNPGKTTGPYTLGEIGIVRNHWYKLTVSAVLKPGVSVVDPDQPIIPNIDPADQYLALDIHILPWHVIGQTIELQ